MDRLKGVRTSVIESMVAMATLRNETNFMSTLESVFV